MIKNELKKIIDGVLRELDLPIEEYDLSHPDLEFGDYSTNVAMIIAKKLKINPHDLAEKIKERILEIKNKNIRDVQIAGPGFINFYLADIFLIDSLREILSAGDHYGHNHNLTGKKILVEYTDPNPFKEFHIGHLMSNSVGESLSRLIEANGAEVKRACYQGDVGLHVAKTIWAWLKDENNNPDLIDAKKLGLYYRDGSVAFKDNDQFKQEIIVINKKIYNRSDEEINKLYDLGKRISLEYFENIYQKLGTKFDQYFFESETGERVKILIAEGLERGIFINSNGAVIFQGEIHDSSLHTRVFINSEGLPTYEAKELGLAELKNDNYKADLFINITGNEINDYFRVVLKALELLRPELSSKIKHLSHGMLRLPSGKMSSRTGEVVTAEFLIDEVRKKVLEKNDSDEIPLAEKDIVADKVAIGALKYSILKQTIGRDIIFDFKKSLSFEGDSGPYLQYSYARAFSVLAKKEKKGDFDNFLPTDVVFSELERLLYIFPEIIERAYLELAPHQLVSYLIKLSATFNSYYAKNKIIGSSEEEYRLALTKAFSIVLKNGLEILGIPILEKM